MAFVVLGALAFSPAVADLLPATLDATLAVGESVSEGKTVNITGVIPKGDILFSFDLTGSMSGEIATAKAEAINIMNSLDVLIGDSKYGVVSYMDYPNAYSSCGYSTTYGSAAYGDYAYSLDQVLTSDRTAVSNSINGLVLGWGADGPQDYERIFYESYSDPNIVYRSGAKKILLNFGDNVPHDCNLNEGLYGGTWSTGSDPGRDEIMGNADDIDLHDALAGMAANNITLLEIHSGGNTDYWDYWTGLTGGQRYSLSSPAGIPAAIFNLIQAQATNISNLTLQVVTPGFAGWLTSVVPASYTNLTAPVTVGFSITITVPPGTPDGVYVFTISAIGDGASLGDQLVTITVDSNDPPVALCQNVQVGADGNCEGMASVDNGSYDPDGDPITIVQTPPGPYPLGQTPVSLIVTDDSGEADTCDATVTVVDDTPPVVTCSPDIAVNNDPGACGAVVSWAATVSDNCPGASVVCAPASGSFLPVGESTVMCIANDAAGNADTCTFTVTVTDNEDPIITSCPGDLNVPDFASLPACDPGAAIATDNCSVTITCTRSSAGGVGCTDTPIPFEYTYTATDPAGNSVQCSRTVTVAQPDCPTMPIAIGNPGAAIAAANGSQITIPVTLSTDGVPISDLNLLLGYDREALSLIGVTRGDALAAWQYFTYRLGTDSECGAGCPSGLIRLVGVADVNESSAPPMEAFSPNGVIAQLTFEVNADQSLVGREFALSAHNLSCADNVISDKAGTMLFVNGMADLAACQAEHPDKLVLASLRYTTGLVRITAPSDGRGDVNLNGIAHEVGDAVLLSSYLIHGNAVLSDDPGLRARQIAASDINHDGVVLSVGDLVYLIRVITGEAAPAGQFKLTPYAESGSVSYRVHNGAMTVSTTSSVDLGGALFVFRYSDVSVGTPVLSAAVSGLSLTSRASNGELRVLISTDERAALAARVDAGTNSLFTVPVDGNGRLELVESQLSDAEGSLLSVQAAQAPVPTGFALLQNYPNPFNAGTVIPFELGREGDWMVQVYNVAGQAVRTFSGHGTAGRYEVSWNGADESGTAVASGMYFYRIVSGEFAATRKMVLLK